MTVLLSLRQKVGIGFHPIHFFSFLNYHICVQLRGNKNKLLHRKKQFQKSLLFIYI